MPSNWPWLLLVGGLVAALALVCIAWHPLFLWLVWLAAAAAVVLRARRRGLDVSFVAGLVLLYVLQLGLRDVPAAVREMTYSYRADLHYASFQESETAAQSSWGVDANFVTFVSQHLPRGKTFYVAFGDAVDPSAPRFWFQYELLPSIEKYDSPCSASWVVLYDEERPPAGLKLDQIISFKPGYALAHRRSPCTL
jgi:hypothetical protein